MMRAGFGCALITPTPPVYLAGFGGRNEPAADVHDDLEARALYLEDGSTSLCLVVCDLLGMSAGFSTPVRQAIAATLGVGLECVLTSCTHTHQGPSVMAGTEALGWPTPEGYAEILTAGCVQAAEAARQHAEPATLRYGRAPLPDGFSFNRRGLPYVDPWFSILDVLGSDQRLGLIANLSIHPVLLGPINFSISTDWVGPFRRRLEAITSGTAIQLTGSLGDINPTPPEKTSDDTYEVWASKEQTSEYGKTLADVVAKAIDITEEVPPTLSIVRAETHEIAVGGTPIAALDGGSTMKVDFIEWDIGGIRLVAIPGEAFHLLGREISAGRGDRVLLAGIAPSWHGYLPHPWGEGYEEGVSFGEDFAREVRERLTSSP